MENIYIQLAAELDCLNDMFATVEDSCKNNPDRFKWQFSMFCEEKLKFMVNLEFVSRATQQSETEIVRILEGYGAQHDNITLNLREYL